MESKYSSLYWLGILVLLCGLATPLPAQVAPVRWTLDPIGKAINRGFLFLQDHKVFHPGNSDSQDGLRPWFEGFGDGSGLSGGLQFSKPLPFGTRGTVGAGLSTNLYQRYAFALTKDFGRIQTGPTFRYTISPEEDFFGQGPGSLEAARSTFALTERAAGWGTGIKFGHVQLRHGLRWKQYTISDGRDHRFPTSQALFSPAAVTGGFRNSRWLTNEAGAVLDYRDEPKDPQAGTGFDASVTRGSGLGETNLNFTTARIVNATYIPFSERKAHVLAFRGELVRNLGGNPVPFYLQPTLGGSGTLRGFREYRFRDRDAIALTGEYRYRVHRYVDAAIFGDFGQVYSDIRKEIDSRRLQAVGGMGVRLNTPIGLRMRLNVGHSHEGTRVFLNLGSTW